MTQRGSQPADGDAIHAGTGRFAVPNVDLQTMPTPTTVTIGSPADGVVVITAEGDIDIDNAYQLRDAVDHVLVDRPAGIRVDLTEVTQIDSVGIGVLVACYYAAAAGQVGFAVDNPTRTVYRRLWAAGLVGLLGSPQPIPDPPVPAQNRWSDW